MLSIIVEARNLAFYAQDQVFRNAPKVSLHEKCEQTNSEGRSSSPQCRSVLCPSSVSFRAVEARPVLDWLPLSSTVTLPFFKWAQNFSPLPIPVLKDDTHIYSWNAKKLTVTLLFWAFVHTATSPIVWSPGCSGFSSHCHSLSLSSSSEVLSLFSTSSATLRGRFLEFTTKRVRYYFKMLIID